MKKASSKRRRRLPFWGMLLMWLVMCLGFAAYTWHQIQQDEAVAPREKMVLGTIEKISHGKQDAAKYSFTFDGKTYHGSEIVRPDLSLGDAVVFFDPLHPSTNTLVEYHHKSRQDRWLLKACLYIACALAVLLAFTLLLKLNRKQQAMESESASLSILK